MTLFTSRASCVFKYGQECPTLDQRIGDLNPPLESAPLNKGGVGILAELWGNRAL